MALGKDASPQSRFSTAGSFLKHAEAFWGLEQLESLETALSPNLKHKAWELMLESCCFTSSLHFFCLQMPAFHAEPKQTKKSQSDTLPRLLCCV